MKKNDKKDIHIISSEILDIFDSYDEFSISTKDIKKDFTNLTDYLSKIDINNEVFDTVSDDVLDNTTTEFHSLSTGTKIMLIVAISLPSVLILYFLIKPSKIMQITKTRKQVKKESRKIRHGDYFEFDESELS